MISKISYTLQVLTAAGARLFFGWNKNDYKGSTKEFEASMPFPSFLSDKTLLVDLKTVITKDILEGLSDEALIKICRQLEFWITEEKLSKEHTLCLTKMLVDQSTWFQQDSSKNFKVPTRRFGKTEINMPILTCGGMRLQNTWLPDFVPVLRPNRKQVLNSPPQENMKNCIRACLKIGMNHFETARFYGTSEYQMVEALHELIQDGEITRSDFIFQTKIPPVDGKNFK